MQHFYATLSRLKLISRWGLMHSTLPENDAEHALQCAVIAHGIALLSATRFDRQLNPEHVMALAVFHDAHEVITGDLPTPVKYHSAEMKTAYHTLEAIASETLLHMLPEDLMPAYTPLFKPDEASLEWRIVKAADRICAYIKCLEERRMGNREFIAAEKSILSAIQGVDLPEVQMFFETFIPAFSLSLDELNEQKGS